MSGKGSTIPGRASSFWQFTCEVAWLKTQLYRDKPLCCRMQALLVPSNSQMCVHARRKYREGPWEHVKAQLMQEKQRMPGAGAAYVLGAKQETPGVFYIGFILAKTPRKEHMVVTGEGVYFRHEVRPIRHSTRRTTGIAGGGRMTSVRSFAPGVTVCGLPLLLWCAVCLSMQEHTYGVSGTHACMDGMLAVCPWLL